ncbi:MAG TPA: cyclic nucleotide-binding domain-containing protein [Ktedonobacterales bacterium]
MFGHHDPQSAGRSKFNVDGEPLRYSTAELVQFMESMPFFAALSAKQRRGLASVGVERSYPAGVNLVQQGQEPGIGLYVILSGRVRVTQLEDDGRMRVLGELGAAQMFGEMALLDDKPRSATVTALEPTIALVIPLYDFRAALSHNGEATIKLLGMLAQRLRAAEAAAE